MGSPVASEKTGEGGLFIPFYTILRQLTVEEYMRTPYVKLELINFYTFSRRHVEFWARVICSKGIVDENIS